MCKKCLITFLIFLVVVIFAFFFIFRSAAKGATLGPVINEIAWAGNTNSADDEWIELYNPSDERFLLKGWKLEAADGSPSIPLEGELPSGGYFLLERTDDTSVPNIKANQLYTGSLDNKGEVLRLIDANGVVRDEVNTSEGWPAGDNTTKATMARDDANLTVATWGNGPVNGTPLAQNVLVAPPAKETSATTQTPAPSKQRQAPVQTAKNTTPTVTPTAADIAAFNARVQGATKNDSSLSGIKDIAGALMLLGLGALATFTIIKKRKKNFEEI